MFDKISGLPAHVLLVHAVVVLVPLACLAVVLHAWWPTARRRLGVVTPLVAGATVVLVPITTHAGNWLRTHYAGGPLPSALIGHHQTLGNQLIYYVIPLFLLALVVWLLGRYLDGASVPGLAPAGDGARTVPSWLPIVLGVVSAALAIATTVQLIRIGDSGAHAVWDGRTQ